MSKKLNKEEAHANYIKYIESYRRYYRKNREKVIKQKMDYYKNKANHQRLRDAQNKNRQKYATEVLMRYSDGELKCACCGENKRKFLTLDHINGNGNDHRRQIKATSSMTMYRWIKKNNFPPLFQVLCMNCNWGKSKNGNICPHKDVILFPRK